MRKENLVSQLRFPALVIISGALLCLPAVRQAGSRSRPGPLPTPTPPSAAPASPTPASAPPKQGRTGEFTNSVGMSFALVPAGSFMMGSNRYRDEQPVHQVTIGYSFYMGRYEVTQGQWQKVMGNNPSYFIVDRVPVLPVQNVSWDDAQEFIKRLNAMNDGYQYRLPSEAEWEYACRAGTTGDYAGDLNGMAKYRANAKMPYPVGGLQANAWGLYDMHGNVYEWCQDWYHQNYDGAPTDGSARLTKGTAVVDQFDDPHQRVKRGGAWDSFAPHLRSATRSILAPNLGNNSVGFRVVAVPRQ